MNSLEKAEVVKQKLKKATKKNYSENQLNNMALKLSEKDKIKKFYLNTNFKAALEYFDVETATPKSAGVLSSSNSTPKSIISNFEEESIEIVRNLEILEENPKINEKIKVKLILTENARTNNQKTFRKLVSPFLNAFDIGDTKLGLIHSAIAIGKMIKFFLK